MGNSTGTMLKPSVLRGPMHSMYYQIIPEDGEFGRIMVWDNTLRHIVAILPDITLLDVENLQWERCLKDLGNIICVYEL